MAAETRPSARQRGYSSRWDRARQTYLGTHPHCAMCTKVGQTVKATVVDHIIPHRGDQALFWNTANWQPLCATHHNAAKRRQENGDASFGADVAGRPLDPAHPWNRARVA